MNETIELSSLRAKKARLGRTIRPVGYRLLISVITICIILGIWLAVRAKYNYEYILGFVAGLAYMLAFWWKQDLSVLPPGKTDFTSKLSVDILSRLKPEQKLSPKAVWQAINYHREAYFLTNHLLLPHSSIDEVLSDDEGDLKPVLDLANKFAEDNNSPEVTIGFLSAALLANSHVVNDYLISTRLQPSDMNEVTGWLARVNERSKRNKQSFGGVGRDWSFGFTPLLDRFGDNLSQGIVKYRVNFGWLTTSDGVLSMVSALSSSSNAVALIGPPGIGKNSHVYALAQKLIEGQVVGPLAYHQVVALDASYILTNSKAPGDLEYIFNNLANEAAKAGHIVLFLENSALFFGSGPGSINAANILLPIIQSRRAKLIMAFTPGDYQRLKISSPALASVITPIVLSELPEASVMHILEDTSVRLEGQNNVLITLAALKEAYSLSGRYNPEEAYPGKAIKLLEQSIANARDGVVSASSVQKTIEQSRGVKVGSAAPIEAASLLHLEERIHKRMINQNRAVNVVASALRRSRAGVSDPSKPIGSFLFLGPTGVGKTELAKSLAAEYFGNEANMIRLDMSEYQQADDVKRLLSTGQKEASSLILAVRQQPFSVVLLDEVEKAHPNILNLLLQLLDEGKLTDVNGTPVSFKDCIIIATSNAGSQEIREHIQKGESLESFEDSFTDQLINSGQFKPELLNRFDEIVLFRPLQPNELAQVVTIMMAQVNKTLSSQNISVELTEDAVNMIVEEGYDPRLGARPMRRVLQRAVEDSIAKGILEKHIQPGDHVRLAAKDLNVARDQT